MSYRVLFVTAHPDDEVLWMGGTLAGMVKCPDIEVAVLCMSGSDSAVRVAEFNRAMVLAGVDNAVVMDIPLPPDGNVSFKDVSHHLRLGLERLNWQYQECDLIVSHGYNGDEHLNYNHKQLFRIVRENANEQNIPFACFAFMPFPYITLTPRLTDARRDFGLHFITLADCQLTDAVTNPLLKSQPPVAFAQFSVDRAVKQPMLECYASINIAQHQQGYSAWDSFVEGFYFFDHKGLAPFTHLHQQMQRPHHPDNLF